MSRLQPYQRDEIVTAYTNGATAVSLSLTYQVTTRSIHRLLYARGVPTQQQRVPAAAKQRMVDHYRNGQTVRQIAATYAVSYGTVLMALRAAGIDPRRVNKPDRGYVERLHTAGTPVKDIAAQVGVHPSTIYRLLGGMRPGGAGRAER